MLRQLVVALCHERNTRVIHYLPLYCRHFACVDCFKSIFYNSMNSFSSLSQHFSSDANLFIDMCVLLIAVSHLDIFFQRLHNVGSPKHATKLQS
jgi:hypothetical protein